MTRPRALAAIHCSAILFGLTGVFGELIQASAAAITAGRAVFAFLALAGFARLSRRSLLQNLTARHMHVLAGAGLLLALHWVTFFHSVKVGGIAVATLGFASFPAFITLFEAIIFRERVTLSEWILLAVVSAGLMLVVPAYDVRDSGTVGLMWGLLSGFSFAMLALVNRRAACGIDAVQVAFWQNLFVAGMALPFAIGSLGTMQPVDWFWLALLGVFCTGLSHYLFVVSLNVLAARSAGLVISLEPVYAIAFAWALFSQTPNARMLVGAAMIVGAIVMSGLRKNAPAPSADAPDAAARR